MEKTTYDDLRIRELILVLDQSLSKEECGEKTQLVLKKYAGKSMNGQVRLILRDLACFLEIYLEVFPDSLLWYRSKGPAFSYQEGRKYFLEYLKRIDLITDISDIGVRSSLFEFYQRWLQVGDEKIEVVVAVREPFRYAVFRTVVQGNYYITIDYHAGGASGKLYFQVKGEDIVQLEDALIENNKACLEKLIYEYDETYKKNYH